MKNEHEREFAVGASVADDWQLTLVEPSRWATPWVSTSCEQSIIPSESLSLFHFITSEAVRQRSLGRVRTSETYSSTLHSFKKFRNGLDLSCRDLNSELMVAYESWLRGRGLSLNTTSFYMRCLRAMYNRAVEHGLCEQRYPFRGVYTGIDRTVKRALSLAVVRRLEMLNLDNHPNLELARDLFMFSFYTRGMAFVDIAHLRQTDLVGNVLSYRRSKTGQRLFIRWEQRMQNILERHPSGNLMYLLPILDPDKPNLRLQYQTAAHRINYHLKHIGGMLQLRYPLTFYVARHSWASVARTVHIPMSIISQGMGHQSERTTRIYLDTLQNSIIDNANRLIIRRLRRINPSDEL